MKFGNAYTMSHTFLFCHSIVLIKSWSLIKLYLFFYHHIGFDVSIHLNYLSLILQSILYVRLCVIMYKTQLYMIMASGHVMRNSSCSHFAVET